MLLVCMPELPLRWIDQVCTVLVRVVILLSNQGFAGDLNVSSFAVVMVYSLDGSLIALNPSVLILLPLTPLPEVIPRIARVQI